MNQPTRASLDYALPQINSRRWSKAAVASIVIPLVALPLTATLVDGLTGFMTWHAAQRVCGFFEGTVHLAGLAIALATLRHIRLSATRLRGRMLAVIGLALNVAGIFFVACGFYIRSL